MNACDLLHVIDEAVDDDTDTGGGVIVLVHGSWTDHATCQFVRPLLADHHVVVAYDRRGHSHSGPSDEATTQAHGTRRPVDHAHCSPNPTRSRRRLNEQHPGPRRHPQFEHAPTTPKTTTTAQLLTPTRDDARAAAAGIVAILSHLT